MVQENYYVPAQITSKDKAFLAPKVTKLHVQFLAAWLSFKLQNLMRMSPKDNNMRRHILTSSHFNLPFTSHKLHPDLSFSAWPLASCQNFRYSYVYQETESVRSPAGAGGGCDSPQPASPASQVKSKALVSS